MPSRPSCEHHTQRGGITSQVSGKTMSWNLAVWEGGSSLLLATPSSLSLHTYKCLLTVPDTIQRAWYADEQADKTPQGALVLVVGGKTTKR